jgi:putative PIG3 family NAD(P)H quinone oxidoreductase
MKAIVLTAAGGPEVIAWVERPDPAPGDGEVLVRVRASAMNRADVLQRRGLYPAPAGAPADIPGLEFAGEVVAHGRGAKRPSVGARVMGIAAGGAHAEIIAVDAGSCVEIPESLSWIEAAAVPEAFLTAFDALSARARLRRGETVLVTAASSGVGTAAVQLATAGGARVIALSRRAAKRERLRQLGAHAAPDTAGRPAERILEAAGPDRRVDVILDLVGRVLWPVYLDVVADLGRIVVIGLLSGARTEIDLGRLLARRASVVGTVLRGRSREEKAALVDRFRNEVLPSLAAARVRPIVHTTFPLAHAADAHRLMERNEHLGKIVLEVEER